VDESRDQTLPPLPAVGRQPDFPLQSSRKKRAWLHLSLFLITFFTTTVVGGCHYLAFEQGLDPSPPTPPADIPDGTLAIGLFILREIMVLLGDPIFYLHGLWYSLTVLAILGTHEMGHYVACRYYGVDATLPYFIPAPLPLTGTLGAVIRIRQRIPSKVALFDIGLAGPIAGFLIVVPTLFVGLALSELQPLPDDVAMSGWRLGRPLLYRLARWVIWGDQPEEMTMNLHPMAFGAWFGLLATALNLFPIGQLDGGHVAYAVLGRRSAFVTVATLALAVTLTFFSRSWVVWTVLMVAMVFVMGPHHPPTLNDDVRMDRTRLILAVIGLLMLIVCFTPAPIEYFETTGR
jgi:membrane-associated protease RseP (regulator of RpoE activity)